jgi:hypothetical protein
MPPGIKEFLSKLDLYLGDSARLRTAKRAFSAAANCILLFLREDRVVRDTFARMARYLIRGQICKTVWLVAGEHLYRLTTLV